MNYTKLKNILSSEPNFRLKQAQRAVFIDLITDWNNNSTLPKELREKLNKECPLTIDATIIGSNNSQTVKAVITVDDKSVIETVLMKHKDGRATVCVSSQVGCAMKCGFCATGKMGFTRNLNSSEIVVQVLFWQRYLKREIDGYKRVSNVVYMGMGEPFLNYDQVMESIEIIGDENFFNIGSRKISVSTCGIVEGIEKFSKEKKQLNLAISLHAPDDKLRSQLMPINKKYSLKKLFSAIEKYVESRSRKVMFEYLLIEGVNDSPEQAQELVKLMNHHLYMVNLIPYNSTGVYSSSSSPVINEFKRILMEGSINVVQRYSFGQDIEAACGQLVGKNN